MTLKAVRQAALHRYSLHKGYSWIIGLSFAIISAALVFLIEYFVGLTYLFALFTIIPMFFAAVVSHRNMTFGKEPSVSKNFKFFIGFFNARFRGVFKCWWTFLKALIVEIGVGLIASIVCYFIFLSISPTFGPSMEKFIDLFASTIAIDPDMLNQIISANNFELLRFFNLVTFISCACAFVTFIFIIGIEEMSVFNRNELANANPQFLNALQRKTIRANSKEFFTLYFGLNWPVILLLVIGLVGGAFLNNIWFGPETSPLALGYSFGLVALGFFLPFYFNNMEAIHESFGNYYEKSSEVIASELLVKLAQEAKINQEDKERIEQELAKLKEIEQQKKDKEKDPPSGS